MKVITAHRGALVGSLASVALGSLLTATDVAPVSAAVRAPTVRAPTVSTGSASHVDESSAALRGLVNPHGAETTYVFQYGTTTAYGAQTVPATAGVGTTGVKVSQALSGLQLGTTYHYRLVAMSSAGTTDGRDKSFTTSEIPLKFVMPKSPILDAYGSPFTIAGNLSGTGAANHQFVPQANPFPYVSSFEDVDKPAFTNASGAFSVQLPGVPQTTQIRLRTLDSLPIYSKAVTVQVMARVTIKARKTKTPGWVRFSGIVEPAEVNAPVIIQRLKPGHNPAPAGRTTAQRASATLSRFSVKLFIRHSGEYRALVKVSNHKQVSGYSTSAHLRSNAPTHSHRHHHKRQR